jgi:hypothetical protein
MLFRQIMRSSLRPYYSNLVAISAIVLHTTIIVALLVEGTDHL